MENGRRNYKREPITLFPTQAVITSIFESLTGLSLHHELFPSFPQNLSFFSFFLFQVHLMKCGKPKTFESSVDVTQHLVKKLPGNICVSLQTPGTSAEDRTVTFSCFHEMHTEPREPVKLIQEQGSGVGL